VPEPEPEPWLKHKKPDRDPVAPLVRPQRHPGRWLTAKSAALAAVAIGVVALAVWMLGSGSTTPPPAPPVESGTVVLDVLPWANIESITNKADNQPVRSGCTATPCVLSLPAGEYHVRASNPNFPGALEFDVTVAPNGLREERRALPAFRVEDEVSRIVGGGR
jgi:hypothetical protein